MSLLSTTITARKALPPRIFLYGIHGVGKTSWAASAPSPIVLQAEEGANELDVPRTPKLNDFAELMGWLTAIYSDQHEHQTIVIDTADWTERLVHDEVCKRHGKTSIEEVGGGYGKGYTAAVDVWSEVLVALDAIRAKRHMAIIILGHSEAKRFDDPTTDSYDRYQPKLHKQASGLIQEWADCVLFATWRTFTTEKDIGFNKERVRAIGTGERLIYTQERPSSYAKNRYRLPAEMPLDWSAFAGAVAAFFAPVTTSPTAATSAA
jgi:hypothetical protein